MHILNHPQSTLSSLNPSKHKLVFCMYLTRVHLTTKNWWCRCFSRHSKVATIDVDAFPPFRPLRRSIPLNWFIHENRLMKSLNWLTRIKIALPTKKFTSYTLTIQFAFFLKQVISIVFNFYHFCVTDWFTSLFNQNSIKVEFSCIFRTRLALGEWL